MVSTDAELVRALASRRGERAARSLYRAYGGELYGFACRRLGDTGLVEEVVQDVFTKAWHQASTYDEARGSVRTWLYAIARNAVTDAERRRGRRPPRRATGSARRRQPRRVDRTCADVVVEKVLAAEPGARYPVCLTGKGRCPPEDCGGVWGYADLRETLADPAHEEHADMLEWLGIETAVEFDPQAFDADDVNLIFGGRIGVA